MKHEQTRIVGLIFLVAICFGISGCCPALTQDGPPSIAFTEVPAYGTYGDLQGYVTGVDPFNYRVVVYIYVYDWWIKPYYGQLTKFNGCGYWEADVTTGGIDHEATQIAAFIVPSDYDPSAHELPSGDDVIASTIISR